MVKAQQVTTAFSGYDGELQVSYQIEENLSTFHRADNDNDDDYYYYYYLRTRARRARAGARARARAVYWARASSQEGTFDFLHMLPHIAKADVAHAAAAY